MTTTIALSALFGGAVASYPLLKLGRQLNDNALDKIERQCSWLFPLLLAGAMWLLFTLYPLRHVSLLVTVATVVAWLATVVMTRISKTSRRNIVFHSIAGVVVTGILVSEGVLTNAAAGKFPYHQPNLYAWVGGKRAIPLLIAAHKESDWALRNDVDDAVVTIGQSAVPALTRLYPFLVFEKVTADNVS